MFDADGKILFQVGTKKGTFLNLSAITVGLNGEILTADYRVQIFSAKGDFMEELKNDGKGKYFHNLFFFYKKTFSYHQRICF